MPSIHLIPLHHLSAKGAGGGRGEEGEERRVSPKLRLIRELGEERERVGVGGIKKVPCNNECHKDSCEVAGGRLLISKLQSLAKGKNENNKSIPAF